jgi:hypothetical protein
MGSDNFMKKFNLFTSYFLIPILFIIYCFYVVFDYAHLSSVARNIVDKKQKDIGMHNDINGLILGGSNALYGLSAEKISKETNQSWFNFSLLSEGFSDENYWEYIENNIPINERLKVNTIIYSSITPLSEQEISERKVNEKNIFGHKTIGLKPQVNLYKYIKEGEKIHNHPKENNLITANSYGDIDFKKIECNFIEEDAYLHSPNKNSEVGIWLINQIKIIHNLFPNAKIYFVLPSLYHLKNYDNTAREILKRNIDETFLEYKKINRNISFIIQDPLPLSSLVCDMAHHPNSEGREWRTKNLLNYMS